MLVCGSWANAQSETIEACVFPTAALGQDEETSRFAEIVNVALQQNIEQLGIDIVPRERWEDALSEEERDRWLEIGGKPIWAEWIKRMKSNGFSNASDILDTTIRLSKE